MKEIDYMLVDALLIQYMLKYQINDVTEHLEIGNTPIRVKSLHFALRKDVIDAERIMSLFNEEITKMIADGSYNAILELNWIQMDVDGDGHLELVLNGNQAGTESPENTYGILMDLAYNEKPKNPKRYFIDGKMYEDWEEVPKSYKFAIPIDNMFNPNDIPLHFRF